MGYQLKRPAMDEILARLSETYEIYAPKVFELDSRFSDQDTIRYGKVSSVDEIVFDRQSDYSFKETLLPVNETLFYFTEDQTSIPAGPQKDLLIFAKSCDLHALKRLDQIYLNNGPEDFYYKRIRERAHFVLIGCETPCENGFCADMGTNRCEDYALYVKVEGDSVFVDVKEEAFAACFKDACDRETVVEPDYVTENNEHVTLPRQLTPEICKDPIWESYGSRCILCGRCNFACPTCTCFTMQDIHYKDNGNVGERRRVWASCQVDGYTDIAGGGSFRKTAADRMRFKVLHKIYDYEKRFGYPMCVGCGRCDKICPEYISYSAVVNKLAAKENEEKGGSISE
ncbi:MAG: anaerobic sulfite reductase subunit A [Eubacterium sp.]|nr:anaerobic sulfite reductase subunit A [Eubacterium sp.]